MEDEVPDAATEPVSATQDPGAASAEPSLEGFAEAFASMPTLGNPAPGQAEEPKAVETDATPDTPEAKADKPEDAKDAPKEPEPAKEKAAAAKTYDFDGFSDRNKATWERLLKDGTASEEEFEAARADALRQSYFSKKTAALARDRESFQAEMAERKEDLALLDKIRADDRLHAAWLKASKGELPDDDEDDTPVSRKEARKIGEESAKGVLKSDRTEAQKAADAEAERRKVFGEVIGEQQKVFGIDAAKMRGYLAEIEATLDDGEPYTARDLRRDLAALHEKKEQAAKIAALEQKLNQRTATAERTAKQSLPPARRVTTSGPSDPMKDAEESLGVAPDWSNVTGFGFRQ